MSGKMTVKHEGDEVYFLSGSYTDLIKFFHEDVLFIPYSEHWQKEMLKDETLIESIGNRLFNLKHKEGTKSVKSQIKRLEKKRVELINRVAYLKDNIDKEIRFKKKRKETAGYEYSIAITGSFGEKNLTHFIKFVNPNKSFKTTFRNGREYNFL